MTKNNMSLEAAAVIAHHVPGFKPKVGIILGSGLSGIADVIEESVSISYAKLPGFGEEGNEDCPGRLVLGKLQGVSVACLVGRKHFYEGISPQVIRTMIYTLKVIGCEILLGTSASGSLRADVTPGELMLITDHINFQVPSPLVGESDARFGSRFVPLENAYDLELRETMCKVAQRLDLRLEQGVYMSTLGPNYETPAEIRAFRTLGVDAVGMSAVPEVLVARHCGLRVVVIATITNMAAGMPTDALLGHEHVVEVAKGASKDLTRLIMAFLEEKNDE